MQLWPQKPKILQRLLDSFVNFTAMRIFSVLILTGFLFSACGVSRRLQQSAQTIVLNDPSLQAAHVGISIYEPATGKWWYNHQGDKYFVPASNTKIVTAYAAMKYLGDSLVGARYAIDQDGAVELFPSGDPTFMHAEFRHQPLYHFLKGKKLLRWDLTGWQDQRWGSGWSWNDYDAAYMAERSPLPMYGNVFTSFLKGNNFRIVPSLAEIRYDTILGYSPQTNTIRSSSFELERALNDNIFYLKHTQRPFTSAKIPIRMEVPFVTEMLKDTLKAVNVSTFGISSRYVYKKTKTVIYSQPTDSLLKPLLHRSDNFFAEQALLMVSNEVLGYMNAAAIIDTILKTNLADLPQKPRWADGSGLSRYNLFTPQSFVAILGKIKTEFGMDRVREVFPTGNEGTLTGYYKRDSTFLYAKTGTLAGVVALSGYLTTASGKELIFSVLVNNHQSTSVRIRRAVEAFLQKLRQNY